MTDSNVFEFGGHRIRTAGTPDAPLFSAADVCAVLGIADAAQACTRLDQDEVEEVASKQPIPYSESVAGKANISSADVSKKLGKRGGRKALYITESGLFALILTSTKPEARAFRKWVTSEVLPEIRRRGVYSLAEALERKKVIDECFLALPAKQATLFDPLIDALRKFARGSEGGSGGTPPWARLIASYIYSWTWQENKSELRKRNPKQDDGTLIWRDYDALTEEGRRRVSITIGMAVFAARESYSWADWRARMEAYFGGQQRLPMSEPERLLPANDRRWRTA
jgi:prophage antirepressor-like protein